MARDGTEPVVRVRGLCQRFGDTVIFEGLDLDVRAEEVVGIVGGSGSGKSILLKSIIGLHKPTEGEVSVFGTPVRRASRGEMRTLQRRWGVVFQADALFSNLTVLENVTRVMHEHLELPRDLAQELAAVKVDMVGLEPSAAWKFPYELSGGMRKKAGLARALALDPDLLVLDEPTAGLDPIAAANFRELVKQLRRTLRLTVFLVTHELEVMRDVCDRVAMLSERRFLAVGPAEEVQQSDHPWVRDFFQTGRAAPTGGG